MAFRVSAPPITPPTISGACLLTSLEPAVASISGLVVILSSGSAVSLGKQRQGIADSYQAMPECNNKDAEYTTAEAEGKHERLRYGRDTGESDAESRELWIRFSGRQGSRKGKTAEGKMARNWVPLDDGINPKTRAGQNESMIWQSERKSRQVVLEIEGLVKKNW